MDVKKMDWTTTENYIFDGCIEQRIYYKCVHEMAM